MTHIATAPRGLFHSEILRLWTHYLINHNNFSCIRANISSLTLPNHSLKTKQWIHALGQALYQALQRVLVTPCKVCLHTTCTLAGGCWKETRKRPCCRISGGIGGLNQGGGQGAKIEKRQVMDWWAVTKGLLEVWVLEEKVGENRDFYCKI